MITVYYVNAVETGALLTFLKSFLRSRSAQWTFTTLAGEGWAVCCGGCCVKLCQLDGAKTALLVLILLQSSIFICDKFLVLINIWVSTLLTIIISARQTKSMFLLLMISWFSSALLLMLLTAIQALTDVLLGRYGENSAVDASQWS